MNGDEACVAEIVTFYAPHIGHAPGVAVRNQPFRQFDVTCSCGMKIVVTDSVTDTPQGALARLKART